MSECRTRSVGGRASALVGAIALALLSGRAVADGGHIALHATSGAYTVTLFTAPVPLAPGPVDLSLLVQDAATEKSLGDAVVAGRLEAEGAAAASPTAPGSRAAMLFTMAAARGAGSAGRSAASPLLLSAQARLPTPGVYTLTLHVKRPGISPEATFQARLDVIVDHSRETTVVVGILAPCGLALLFLLNQHAKQRARLRLTA